MINILFHGRFQPPHKGHFEIIKRFLKRYNDSRIIISLDIRRKDELNPFSFEYRKELFLQNLDNVKDRIIITKHRCREFSSYGCLNPVYENAKKFGEIDLVIGGSDLTKEVRTFWNSKGVKLKTVNKRVFDLSATEIRTIYNAQNLGFSIIITFGCNNNCWYCVWKNFHKLKNIHSAFKDTNWDKLNELIRYYPGNKINISGGLDPLYEYKSNLNWWNRLFKIARENNKLIDVHTREFVFEKSFLSNINKLVISFDTLEKIEKQMLRYYSKGTKIRLVKVITKETKLRELVNAVNFCRNYGFQITFKELYGFDDNCNFIEFENKLKNIYDFNRNKIRFLKNKDYNIYYMPDNKVYDKFMI